MPIETLWPTYIYRAKFSSVQKFNRELAVEIGQLEAMDHEGVDWSRTHYIGGYSSYSSLCNLHQTSPNFGELEKKLCPHVRRFVKKLNWNLLGREIRMTTCWANSMGHATYHTLHNHPSSVISGVYYVDVPKGSSAFKIEDPRMGLLMASPPRKSTAPKAEQNYIQLEPQAGQFILFEGWMRHEVPPHRGRKPRLSISFNYEWI